MSRRLTSLNREFRESGVPRRAVAETNRTTVARMRRRGEAGDTLVEVLIALVVLGLASVALIIAFGTSISASADHRQLSASGVALDAISQQVIADMQATPSLFTCPYVFSNYEAATFGAAAGTNNYITVPTGFTATFTRWARIRSSTGKRPLTRSRPATPLRRAPRRARPASHNS